MNTEEIEKKLIAAYDNMLNRLHILIHDAEEQTLPTIQEKLEKAKRQAIELKEVSVEEAENVALYLKRDVHDAAEYIETSGKELVTWFKFDLEQVELNVLDKLSIIADKTRVELAQIAAQAAMTDTYRTGQVTGIGTLACISCGTEIHFSKTSRIPPCPKCHKTIFKRVKHES